MLLGAHGRGVSGEGLSAPLITVWTDSRGDC
jgi:hypothetical protein